MPKEGYKTVAVTISENEYTQFMNYCRTNNTTPTILLRDFINKVATGQPTIVDIYKKVHDISVEIEKHVGRR